MTAAVSVAALLVLTLLIGTRGVAAMRTTSDFLVASRQVSPLVNAAAVSGEYLSAASFLGIAGLMLKSGAGALWYAVGFTAGYVVMLTLVAAPMRRSGALTVPDFAEARLQSLAVRRLSAVIVLVIATLYVVAQFRTAGLVLGLIAGTPYWVGVVLAAATVSLTVALGGMRAATYVQAFQFALKLVLFAGCAAVLLVLVGGQTREEMGDPVEFTHFEQRTRVTFDVPVTLGIAEPTRVLVAGEPRTLPPGEVDVGADERFTFPRGAAVPSVDGTERPGGRGWAHPLVDSGATEHPLLSTWGVLLATMFGAMGLPHILVRFHTSPSGAAARRTAAFTVALLSAFYLFPGVYGALARVLTPQLYLSGGADTAVVALPMHLGDGPAGTVLTALLSTGAFSAVLATSLGLVLVVSSAVAHDLMPARLRTLRLSALGAAALFVAATLLVPNADADALVTWAFTIAAATFCPLLVLGIWWDGLTTRGAAAGMTAGLVATSAATCAALFGPELAPWATSLLRQPALWTVPLAFALMLLVSRWDPAPRGDRSAMVRLHLARPAGPSAGTGEPEPSERR
ncbi:sodium/solute symporter [Salinifilum ghardaiensis]